tara:strand:- start:325 stop:1647 length:1323 start_codon:yes stop_codon:yes gene_type:complete
MANLVTSEEILPLIEPILSNANIINVKDTSGILEYRIESDDRAVDREKVENLLSSKRITYGELTRKVGGFGGSEIVTFDMRTVRIIYKLKSNKGSGGGAEATTLTESAQCLYAAIAFGLNRIITSNDITPDNVKKYSNLFDIDETNERILNELPDEWVESSLLGANKLFERFKGKGKYVFHRGSSEVDKIEAAFKRVSKNENVRININKWNPSDIWMISSDFSFDFFDKENTILGLNQVVQEKLEENILIGVSLKKIIGTAKISVKNVFRDMKTCKYYAGYEYSKKSIDGYVLLTGGTKIQYRSFGSGDGLTGFQGEVKGSNANQGKISLGPTNLILKNHGQKTIPTNASKRVKEEPDKVFADISKGLKKYARMTDSDIKKIDPKIITPKFLYSKLQVTQLLDILERKLLKSDKRNQIVEDLYLYASSQSKYSSAYYKLE